MPTLTINGRDVQVDDSFLNLSPEQQNATVDHIAPSIGATLRPESSLPDWARFGMTAVTRGLGNLADFATDPLSPVRRMIDPRLERMEQSAKPHPGQAAGNAVFSATGVPEYQPTTQMGRAGMAAAQGAVGGAPFGVGGALLGAASGAIGQKTLEETGSERLATAASLLPGAAAGALGTGVGAARSFASPRAQALMDAGVRPTPGQIMGGTVGRMEEALTSVPGLGDIIKSGRARAVEQFDRGAINNALAPIGEKLRGMTIDRSAIGEAWDKVSDAYQRAVPEAGARLTTRAVDELTNLRQLAQEMPADHARIFDAKLKRYVLDRVSPNGHMSGEAFKMAESDLGNEAAGYQNSPNSTFHDRNLGDALREAQGILRGSLEEANPEAASGIRAANQAFSRMLRVGDASGRSGVEPGKFSPAQMQAAVKKYATPRQYQTGRALMQEYADAGRSVLGDRVPDSGTPLRSLAALLGGAAIGGGGPGLATIAPALAGILPAWAMYSPRGQAAIAQLLAGQPKPGLPFGARGLIGSGSASNDMTRYSPFGALSP